MRINEYVSLCKIEFVIPKEYDYYFRATRTKHFKKACFQTSVFTLLPKNFNYLEIYAVMIQLYILSAFLVIIYLI